MFSPSLFQYKGRETSVSLSARLSIVILLPYMFAVWPCWIASPFLTLVAGITVSSTSHLTNQILDYTPRQINSLRSDNYFQDFFGRHPLW